MLYWFLIQRFYDIFVSRCDDGYFGNPTELGSSCQKCECNGGPCDHLSGQCLRCRGNTEGWKCDRCKPGHYGDPKMANCKPCQCDFIGAVSEQCDLITGECECNERFIGITCSECQVCLKLSQASFAPLLCQHANKFLASAMTRATYNNVYYSFLGWIWKCDCWMYAL